MRTAHYDGGRCIATNREATMKSLLFLALLGTTMLFNIQPGAAREYPWCAFYGPSTQNCGFVSFAQCRATISGVGGHCGQNPMYQGPQPRRGRQYRPY